MSDCGTRNWLSVDTADMMRCSHIRQRHFNPSKERDGQACLPPSGFPRPARPIAGFRVVWTQMRMTFSPRRWPVPTCCNAAPVSPGPGPLDDRLDLAALDEIAHHNQVSSVDVLHEHLEVLAAEQKRQQPGDDAHKGTDPVAVAHRARHVAAPV